MERGELSTEPENELGKIGQENRQLVSGRRGRDSELPSIKALTHTEDVARDDFFGDDDERDSQQSEAFDS